ncbi:MAG: hypothetical protein RRB13_01535 [bacterium]|nr:hypothetical protein [bacterium]
MYLPKSPWVLISKAILLALLLWVAACEPQGEVIEQKNQFGGKTLRQAQDLRSRLQERTTYYDDQGRERFEVRIPLEEAAANLGFNRQEVKWFEMGKIQEDLRFSPEELPNERQYLRYLRRFDESGKIVYAEVDFKESAVEKLGYKSVHVFYNQDDDPQKVVYFDAQGNQLGTKRVSSAQN